MGFLDNAGVAHFWEKIKGSMQGKLTGTAGQVVGFDADGAATAVPGWSNPNLLDNWYFADKDAIINQKGLEEYVSWGYTIDRWHIHSYTTLTVEDGFVRWTVNDPVYQVLIQVVEDKSLIGKEVTASYLVRTNNKNSFRFGIRNDYFVFAQEENEWTLVTVTGVPTEVPFSISGGRPYAAIQVSSNQQTVVQPGDYIDIKAVKLELGPQQTLAHQDADGNWALNDPPPDKALELAKCQRYMLVLPNVSSAVSYPLVGFGSAYSGGNIKIGIPTPVPMRAIPAASISGAWDIVGLGKAINFSASNNPIYAVDYAQNLISVHIANISNLTNNQIYSLQLSNDPTAKIILDANL